MGRHPIRLGRLDVNAFEYGAGRIEDNAGHPGLSASDRRCRQHDQDDRPHQTMKGWNVPLPNGHPEPADRNQGDDETPNRTAPR
jgi:hypothetical protein